MRRAAATLLLLAALLASCAPAGPSAAFSVESHPNGALYVGDRVSFEVLAPAGLETDGTTIQVEFDSRVLGSADFGPHGIGGRSQATLWWVWDTGDLEPGRHSLTFTQLPDGASWTETIRLRPADQVPLPEPEAAWAEVSTDCCTIHYITGTDAARDIAVISEQAEAESVSVAAQLGALPLSGISVVVMSRLIGHGGFTWGSVYVSYLDANYIGNDLPNLFHHEFVHYYDAAIGGDYRPAILQEGLAVYLTGGHFKPEQLGPRAAALLDLGWYIPLAALADGFYDQQHDIGYLEAGALVEYLVESYGWGAFNEFYRTMGSPSGRTDSEVLDAALGESIGLSLVDLEAAFLADLRLQAVSDDDRADLRLTVAFFDMVRRYQAALDPSAYFLTAWLPDGEAMRQEGLVADLLRRPTGFGNWLVESLLARAQVELFAGDYEAAERSLGWAEAALDLLAP
jgi:hypothetical protein